MYSKDINILNVLRQFFIKDVSVEDHRIFSKFFAKALLFDDPQQRNN